MEIRNQYSAYFGRITIRQVLSVNLSELGCAKFALTSDPAIGSKYKFLRSDPGQISSDSTAENDQLLYYIYIYISSFRRIRNSSRELKFEIIPIPRTTRFGRNNLVYVSGVLQLREYTLTETYHEDDVEVEFVSNDNLVASNPTPRGIDPNRDLNEAIAEERREMDTQRYRYVSLVHFYRIPLGRKQCNSGGVQRQETFDGQFENFAIIRVVCGACSFFSFFFLEKRKQRRKRGLRMHQI